MGASYRDFYKVVVDSQTSHDWTDILIQLKREFLDFQTQVLLQKASGDSGLDVLTGQMAYSLQGNVLEAINLAAHQFAYDNIDRDLLRSGLSILVVSPGTGHFEVSEELLRVTTENLINHGIGIDLMCLSRMPLHSVLLFKYCDSGTPVVETEESAIVERSSASHGSTPDSEHWHHQSALQWTYALPHWMDVSFWTRKSDSKHRSAGLRFVPRCKMHELQMMGIMENEMSSIAIDLLAYPENFDEISDEREKWQILFDQDVFKPIHRQIDAASLKQSRGKDVRITRGFNVGSEHELAPPVDPQSRRRRGSKAVLDQYNLLRAAGEDAAHPEQPKRSEVKTSSKELPMTKPWQILENPLNPSSNVFSLNSNFRRWQHVFPRPLSTSSVKWKSMCRPAALPLSTEYFPSYERLYEEFQEYSYVVTADPDYCGCNQKELFMLMTAQRLAQGYQIVIASAANAEKFLKLSKEDFSAGPLDNIGSTIVLTLGGNQIHQLTCDPSGFDIEVKRYVRKSTFTTKFDYQCLIWGDFQPQYRPLLIQFTARSTDGFNWNYVDQVISGNETQISDAMKMWRVRFVLIPCDVPHQNRGANPGEELNDEEVRLAGITRLNETFRRSKWISYDERTQGTSTKPRKDISAPDMIFTTLTPSAFVVHEYETLQILGSEAITHGLFVGNERLNKKMKLSALAQDMQSQRGLPLRDRRWHLRFYENVFVGNEMVSWLLENFTDISTRPDAVEYGNDLKDRGLFEHVDHRHSFLDGHYFYIFRPEYAPTSKQSKGWFGSLKPSSRPVLPSPVVSATTAESLSSVNRQRSDSSPTQSPAGRPARVELGNRMRLNLDQARNSYRSESVQLYYDRVYNPETCYHIQLEWISVTARLIVQSLQSWARTAAHHGLRLVEAPLEEIASINLTDPLRDAVEIQLNKDFVASHPPGFAFQAQLLKLFDFVLDHEADRFFPKELEVSFGWYHCRYRYSQYIHRSGVAFTQISDRGTFYWLSNRFYVSRKDKVGYGTARTNMDPDSLRKSFVAFCDDSVKLEELYSSFIQQSNPIDIDGSMTKVNADM